MSDNIFTPVVDTMIASSKLTWRYIKEVLNLNTLDFKKLFEEIDLCN